MPTSQRKFHVIPQESQLLPGLFFAVVTNLSKTRIVYNTGMYDRKGFAAAAASQWAKTSQSKQAKSLEPAGTR